MSNSSGSGNIEVVVMDGEVSEVNHVTPISSFGLNTDGIFLGKVTAPTFSVGFASDQSARMEFHNRGNTKAGVEVIQYPNWKNITVILAIVASRNPRLVPLLAK